MTPDSPFQFSRYSPRELEIIDTTLREGAQTSLLHDHYKYFFNQTDKMEIVRALIIYGVKFIELFAPIVSPRERDDLAAIQAVRDELITQKGYTFLLAHVRCHPDDIESAIHAGFDGLNLYVGTSLQARTNSHGKDLDEIVRQARACIEQVRRDYPRLILRFSGEDAFRTSVHEWAVANSRGLFAYHPATAADLTVVVMAEDSSGYATDASWKVAEIDVTARGDEAIGKALRSRNPQVLEPGVYPVILEPYAVHDILETLAVAAGATFVQEGRSWLSGRQGQQLMSTRTVHPREAVITGMTRDGTFLIEHGELTTPVRNLRFTQSYVEALAKVEAVGCEARRLWGEPGMYSAPALKLAASGAPTPQGIGLCSTLHRRLQRRQRQFLLARPTDGVGAG